MNFIYVMSEEAKEALIAMGYALVREDSANSVFCFENKHELFADTAFDFPHVVSNVLTL